jgi:hypothetical protein
MSLLSFYWAHRRYAATGLSAIIKQGGVYAALFNSASIPCAVLSVDASLANESAALKPQTSLRISLNPV